MEDKIKEIEATNRPTGPFYLCDECCDEMNCHPASELYWSEELVTWVCEHCWDDAHWEVSEEDVPGITEAYCLKDYLEHGGKVDED
jgi:hypothetical protein